MNKHGFEASKNIRMFLELQPHTVKTNWHVTGNNILFRPYYHNILFCRKGGDYMNLKYLSYFIKVAEHENFTKASNELFVCQSTLSKSVMALEKELGTSLIDRTSNEFRLTPHGILLCEKGKYLLDMIEKQEENIYDMIQGNQGVLRIGIPPVILTAYFPSIIYEFQKQNPKIKLHVIEAGANTIKERVDNGAVDLGVIIFPFAYPGYHVVPLASSFNTLLVHKSHPLAHKETASFKELIYEDFLILDNTYMLHDRILSNCRNAGFEPRITCESSQWDFLAEMVSLNQRITILPHPITMRFHSNNIKRIKLTEPEFPWDIAIIVKKEKYISNLMDSFIQFSCEKVLSDSQIETPIFGIQ